MCQYHDDEEETTETNEAEEVIDQIIENREVLDYPCMGGG